MVSLDPQQPRINSLEKQGKESHNLADVHLSLPVQRKPERDSDSLQDPTPLQFILSISQACSLGLLYFPDERFSLALEIRTVTPTHPQAQGAYRKGQELGLPTPDMKSGI